MSTVDEQLRRIERLERMPVAGEGAATPEFRDPTCPHQSAFIEDAARLKLILTTRRAGKSFGVGRWLLEGAWASPNVSCLYIALTRDSAETIMWRDVILALNDKLALHGETNLTKLRLTLPNGSDVRLLGMDADEDEKRKLLGGKYQRVGIDEAASFRTDLHNLVYGVLKPAVADLRGSIAIFSMPTDIHSGLFYELAGGQDPMQPGRWSAGGWSCHRWSFRENPYVAAQMAEEEAELIAANPRIEETPLFQRNYRGRWVIDTDNMTYRYLRERNDFDGKLPSWPRGAWHYVLGVDLGYTDATALCVCAYHDYDKVLYVVESRKEAGLDITATANRIKVLSSKYSMDRIVVDNANKQAVEEMVHRHGLPLFAADKTGKADFIEIMNSEFIQGRIKLGPACEPLKEEYANLIWDARKLPKREEHPGCDNHCCDAALYAWRFCYNYLATTPKDSAPAHGSSEWLARQQAELEQSVADDMRKEEEESEERARQRDADATEEFAWGD